MRIGSVELSEELLFEVTEHPGRDSMCIVELAVATCTDRNQICLVIVP